MPKISNTLRTLLGRARETAPAPVAEVAQDIETAKVELAAAEAAVTEAETLYRSGLLDADDDTLRALAESQATAGMRRDRARALVARFEEQMAAAQAAERQAELARIVGEADAATAEFRVAAESDLSSMIGKARRLADLAAAAERARETAIRALRAAGSEEMPPAVEAFRHLSGRPEKTLAVDEVELWVDERGNAVGYQDKIAVGSDGGGILRLPNATYMQKYTRRRRFERTEFLPATAAYRPPALVAALNKIAEDLAHLERPAEPAEDNRRPEIRLRPLAEPIEVIRRQEPTRRAG